jgi:solute carrier family 25 ornithine transporter 2/15
MSAPSVVPSSSPSSLLSLSSNKSHFKETLSDIFASAFGAACCVYSGQPFDTVKVRMQLYLGKHSSSVVASAIEKVSISQVVKQTLREGGILSLWRGSLPALTGQVLENPVGFATNGFLKRFFPEKSSSSSSSDLYEKSFLRPFVIGGITGIFGALVLCPCDLIKCRAQGSIEKVGSKTSSVTILEISRSIVKRNGFLGLWKGFSVQVFRDIPFNAAFFGTYDIFGYLLRQHTNWNDGTVYFVSGG